MTISVNIHEAKAQLSHLINLVEQGESVQICRRNVPVAEFKKIEKKKKSKRQFGLLKGKVHVPPEFFEPMSEEELALWYDAPINSNDADKP
ncbi:MAG: type II toxin-antitoxin system prevent-host-death family antitoxin [Rickettsiales bacterium]